MNLLLLAPSVLYYIIMMTDVSFGFLTVTSTFEGQNGYLVLGQSFTCICTFDTDEALLQFQLLRLDGSNDADFDSFGSDVGSGTLSRSLSGANAVYNEPTLRVTVSSFVESDHGPDYNCRITTAGGSAESDTCDMPTIIYPDPLASSAVASIDGCSSGSMTINEGDDVTVRGTAYSSSDGTESVNPSLTIAGTPGNDGVHSMNTVTFQLSADAVVSVTPRLFDLVDGATITCDITVETEEKNKKDKCHPSQPIRKCWWKIFLLILAILAVIGGGIITVILFKMKKGCFAKKGSH